MDGNIWLTALGLALIIEGLMPLIAPAVWRQAFSQLLQLQDGQLRFIGLLGLAGGLSLIWLAS
jgi:uncharacterized protein YjeT (DUF2065 family)